LPHVIAAVNNENLPPGTDGQQFTNMSTCTNGCATDLPVPAAGALDCVGVGDWQPIAADTDDNFELVDLLLEVEVAIEDEKSSIVNGIYLFIFTSIFDLGIQCDFDRWTWLTLLNLRHLCLLQSMKSLAIMMMMSMLCELQLVFKLNAVVLAISSYFL